ncbi:MAG: BamA/TamA family outer membrane protein [candidate division Zixibacteria bacterium]|nr:BamA/TamA family outer membrane protein [candidate division Zixibacteria bacterium]
MGNRAWVLLIVFALVLTATTAVAEGEYTKYESKSKTDTVAVLEIGSHEWTLVMYRDGQPERFTCEESQVKRSEDGIALGSDIKLNDQGITAPGISVPMEKIGNLDIETDSGGDITRITFLAVEPGRAGTTQRPPKDRLSFWQTVTVPREDFIRGSVVAFNGDVDVHGEVNRDVVAIFGDVHVFGGAVVRGDIIALNGSVKLDPEASVYGTVTSAGKESTARRHRARRWKAHDGTLGLTGEFAYNRVDGVKLMAGVKYDHPDSVIPSFEVMGGYAFSSERGRYRVEATQTVLRGPAPVQIGGRVYRLLKSDDDKIISETENTIFALVVNEDWKDYYEAEGAYGFLTFTPIHWGTLEVGYLSENQKWFDAHPKLWSLFGSKEFRGNFSSVPYPTLESARADFDDQQVTSLNLKATVDTRDDEKDPYQGWLGFLAYEYSPGDWQGDFDFSRLEGRLLRIQPLSRYLSLHLLGAYGRVDGDGIPLNRRFFLGGLGTVHGYRHKAYLGNEYFFLSGEYRFRIPHTKTVPFIQFDGGKIGADKLSGNDPWYSSIGVGIAFEPSFKIFLSKRLDRSNEDPIIYARLSTQTF